MVIAFWCAGLSVACAADAFFAPDGKTVTLTTYPRGLGTVKFETGVFTPIALPKALQEAAITSIARGAEGEILFLAQDAVWVLKDQEPVRQVCKTSPLLQATDLAVVTHDSPSLKDWMMVSATEKPSEPGRQEPGLTLYGRKPGDKEFGKIFCRRTPNVTSGAFTPDGRFFFVCENDIWEGEVSSENDPDSWKGVLAGARVAPLSVLSTDAGNARAMWAREVAVAGTWIYATLGGHHMGAIVRAPMPAYPVRGPPR